MKNRVIMTSNMIIDIDFGLIKNIFKEYNNPEYFENLDIADNDLKLKYALSYRKERNPLSIIIKDKYKSQMDNLYEQFIEQDYDKILLQCQNNESGITDIRDLVNTYTMTKLIEVVVICKNLQEQQLINKLCKKSNIIISSNYKELELEEYDSIFTKYLNDILQFKNVNCKNIFMSNCAYNFHNFEKNIPIIDISSTFGKSNKISAIDIYKLNKPLG